MAACYLDSLATLEVPAIGYGIRYEFGIFDQEIRDGCQVEVTDKWLQKGNPWEIVRPGCRLLCQFRRTSEIGDGCEGRERVRWIPEHRVKGVACDTPVLGYRVNTCNTLRLWKSEAVESFDFQDFNVGDYYGAVEEKVISETLSKVLYPNDEPEFGKRLRLAQQYFFVSCSLQDMLRLLDLMAEPVARLPDVFAVQLNDTHPSIAVAELMRLLVDERLLPWDEAWDITRRTLAYTNHTLLPEALETWGLPLFQDLLPRPLEIIYEINRRFLDEVRQRYPGDEARVARVSVIGRGRRQARAHGAPRDRGQPRRQRRGGAALEAAQGDGAAGLRGALAGTLPQRDQRRDPAALLGAQQPALSRLLDESVGEGWPTDLSRLRALEAHAGDAAFQDRMAPHQAGEQGAAGHRIRERTGVMVDPAALFDMQVKRIHEYKRQHLNVLHIVTLYQPLCGTPQLALAPRCFVFGGKAAPGYRMAKLMIRLINGVAAVVNDDPPAGGRLKVVFFPDFNVTMRTPSTRPQTSRSRSRPRAKKPRAPAT